MIIVWKSTKCNERFFSARGDATRSTKGDMTQGQMKTSRRVQPGVQDDASRRAGLQNGNPRDYCTYKRFTVCGPFAEPKGGRGRYGNRQAEASTYPSISPDASRRLRRLSLSLRQVILLRRPEASTTALVLFFSSYSFPSVFLRGRCASSSLRSLFRGSDVVASRCARWSRLSRFFPSAMEFPTNKRTNVTLICGIVIDLPALANTFQGDASQLRVRKHKIWTRMGAPFFALLFHVDKIFIFKQKNFVYPPHDSAQIQTTFDINFRMHMHVHTQN